MKKNTKIVGILSVWVVLVVVIVLVDFTTSKANARLGAAGVPLPQMKATVISNTATAEDTARAMLAVVKTYKEQLVSLLPQVTVKNPDGSLNQKNTIIKAWNFGKKHIKYELDPPTYEALHTPARLWYQKFGDCDDQAIFLGSLLALLKIPFKFRIVGYKGSNSYQHVFVVSWIDGIETVLDYVPEVRGIGHTPTYAFYRDFIY